MEIQNQVKNQYEKSLNNIEVYLLRVIKRFFDTEDLNTFASREAIIAEAMSRYKTELSYSNLLKGRMETGNPGVLHVNNKTGITNINLQDLKGEYAFKKKTAFNKNFGITAGTICEGNDIRLSNSREPLEHTHNQNSITELTDKLTLFLKTIVTISQTMHMHKNKSLLDKITYTGTNNSIDLIIIEEMETEINSFLDLIQRKSQDMNNDVNLLIKELDDTLKALSDKLIKVKADDDKEVIKFDKELEDYINEKIKELKEQNSNNEKAIVLYDELNPLIDNLNNTFLLKQEAETTISDHILSPILTGEQYFEIPIEYHKMLITLEYTEDNVVFKENIPYFYFGANGVKLIINHKTVLKDNGFVIRIYLSPIFADGETEFVIPDFLYNAKIHYQHYTWHTINYITR